MNLTEAFDVALPDIPAKKIREIIPKMHPRLVGGEHLENGVPIVNAVISGRSELYRFSPMEWALVQWFDGERSYQQIADLFLEQTGISMTADEVREFAANLAASDFWYKSPLEQNVALYHKLSEERRKRVKKKSRYGDITYIQFSGWDPDAYFDKTYPYLKWVYSRWFTVLTLVAFALMVYVWFERWGEYSRDTIQFFNFADKSLWDIVEFYVLAVVVLWVHESAHGLTCKHYGAPVHDMGFHLIYLTPAFYVDATEAWVYATKWQRVMVVVSGVWSELILCAIATPIWRGTPVGSLAHDISYKVVLITGLSVIFINWNPLIKLDGYYILSEILGIVDLKENSTAYVSQWVRRHIFHLPVEVDYVPKRRRPFYVGYSLLSGVYSYSLLYFFAAWIGNIFHSFTPEWSFIPTVTLAYLMFRSRIRTFGRFMKTLWLDKKDFLLAWFTPQRRVAAAAVLLLVLFTPLWRDSTEGRFMLEPVSRAMVRAAVPGSVEGIYADEGQSINAGAPLAQLSNLKLESEASQALAEYRLATARATQAQLRYSSYGAAENQRQQLAQRSRMLQDEVAMLRVTSPISGVVVTPRVRDRLGSYLLAGTEIAEVADLSTMRARLFVPEFDVRKARVNAPARLVCDSSVKHIDAVVAAMAPVSSGVESDLIHLSAYKGIRPPNFYVFDLLVKNPDGTLKAGMAGTGKIYGPRRSIAAFVWEPFHDFLGRKIW